MQLIVVCCIALATHIRLSLEDEQCGELVPFAQLSDNWSFSQYPAQCYLAEMN